jgi:hypothetical protein
MATLPPNLKITRDQTDELFAAISMLAELDVLAGFPEESSERNGTEDTLPQSITNAALGYIHDNGAPEQNIPQRPFMLPAMQEVRGKVTDKLTQIARRVVVGHNPRTAKQVVKQGLEQVGSAVEIAIKMKINEGVPPPLAESTLKKRAAKGRKGAQKELDARAKGEAPSTANAKPLIDTAQMRNAVKYVIRPRSR